MSHLLVGQAYSMPGTCLYHGVVWSRLHDRRTNAGADEMGRIKAMFELSFDFMAQTLESETIIDITRLLGL